MGLAVFLPDVGTELADNQDGIALAHALRYVLGQRTEAGHLNPCRVAVAPAALGLDARRTRQPERRHRSVATAFDLSSGVARDVYLCIHRLILSLPDNASSPSGCGRRAESSGRLEICGRRFDVLCRLWKQRV